MNEILAPEQIYRSLVMQNEAHEKIVNQLKEEVKKLKDEHFKDELISELLAENEKLRTEIQCGFPMTLREKMDTVEWMNSHDKECSFGHGCVGGKYKYIFTPTSIGTPGVVKCKCGEEFKFRWV